MGVILGHFLRFFGGQSGGLLTSDKINYVNLCGFTPFFVHLLGEGLSLAREGEKAPPAFGAKLRALNLSLTFFSKKFDTRSSYAHNGGMKRRGNGPPPRFLKVSPCFPQSYDMHVIKI